MRLFLRMNGVMDGNGIGKMVMRGGKLCPLGFDSRFRISHRNNLYECSFRQAMNSCFRCHRNSLLNHQCSFGKKFLLASLLRRRRLLGRLLNSGALFDRRRLLGRGRWLGRWGRGGRLRFDGYNLWLVTARQKKSRTNRDWTNRKQTANMSYVSEEMGFAERAHKSPSKKTRQTKQGIFDYRLGRRPDELRAEYKRRFKKG